MFCNNTDCTKITFAEMFDFSIFKIKKSKRLYDEIKSYLQIGTLLKR